MIFSWNVSPLFVLSLVFLQKFSLSYDCYKGNIPSNLENMFPEDIVFIMFCVVIHKIKVAQFDTSTILNSVILVICISTKIIRYKVLLTNNHQILLLNMNGQWIFI